ncbi:MAG: phosphatidate cytidylyltransferase [Candidatus Dojkabacteria bacterium]
MGSDADRTVKTSRNDILRKAVHISFGTIIAISYWNTLVPLWSYLALLVAGLTLSLFIKTGGHVPIIELILHETDKDDYLPAHGVVFFYLGFISVAVLASLLELDKVFVVVPVLITAYADPATYLVGRFLGRIWLPFKSDKNLEGVLGGMVIAILTAVSFIPLQAALPVGVISMITEIPNVRIGDIEIDDNLIVTITAFIVMYIVL